MRGVGSVYLTFAPDLAVPGAAELIRAFSSQAVASGVENIVLLSGRGEPHVLPSEQAVRESGARFTIIRSAWFAQNFSEGHVVDQVRSGVFAFPGGDCAEPFLDIEDIADVAVAALTDSRHSGQIYELTGPRLLTFHEALKEISAAAGRTITYVPISKAEYRAALLPHLPAEVVYFMTDLFEAVLDGHNSHLANGVELALGRKARDFSDFARTAAATGAFGRSARNEARGVSGRSAVTWRKPEVSISNALRHRTRQQRGSLPRAIQLPESGRGRTRISDPEVPSVFEAAASPARSSTLAEGDGIEPPRRSAPCRCSKPVALP